MPFTLKKSDAFLLRAVDYGESDRVLTLYTRGFGKVGCLAKGARASRRRFAGALQPFLHLSVALRMRPSGGLGILEEAVVLRHFPGLHADLDRMAWGWRLLELADQLEESGAVHPAFFDALEFGLAGLGSSPDPEESAAGAQGAMLALAGWAPRVDACVSCRRAWPFPGARLGLADGGLVCAACPPGGAVLRLTPAELSSLRALFSGAAGQVKGALPLLQHFIQYQLGKALKSAQFHMRLKAAL